VRLVMVKVLELSTMTRRTDLGRAGAWRTVSRNHEWPIKGRYHASRLTVTRLLWHNHPQRYISELATQLQLLLSALPRIWHTGS
jgi:hypothetical protein